MKRVLGLYILLFLTSLISEGQVLVLTHKRLFKTVIFKENDPIEYLLNDDNAKWKSGRIDSFDSASFTINNVKVNIHQIAAIKIRRNNFLFAASGGNLLLAGTLLSSIRLINDKINSTTPKLSQGAFIISFGLIVSGILLAEEATKKCVIGKKYSIEIFLF